jgi:hypothetical protein
MEQDPGPDTIQGETIHPAGTAQPGVQVNERTGEPRVDAAIRKLADLDDLPVPEHAPVFEHIHGQLVEVLGELHHGADAACAADGGDPA